MAERRRRWRLRGALVLLLFARWVGADGGGHVDEGTAILTLGQYLDKRVVRVWIGEQMVALAVAMHRVGGGDSEDEAEMAAEACASLVGDEVVDECIAGVRGVIAADLAADPPFEHHYFGAVRGDAPLASAS